MTGTLLPRPQSHTISPPMVSVAASRMVTGLSVEVRELQDGVWHAIAYPVGPRSRIPVADGVPVAAEWRGPVHAPASTDLVTDQIRWQPGRVGFGRRSWLTAPARAALYELVDRAWNTYAKEMN